MSLTYSQFKTYVTTSLWRTNDTVLANNLDTLILQANSELDKLTRNWEKRVNNTQILPETEDYDLTANVTDLEAVVSVANNADNGVGPAMGRTTVQHIYELRTVYTAMQPFYAYQEAANNKYLRFAAPFSASEPGDLQLQYRRGIPDYEGTDASWFSDEYLDVYVWMVLKHCALFLREDERVAAYQKLLDTAFDIADTDDKHNLQFGGSPLHMKPHHPVP